MNKRVYKFYNLIEENRPISKGGAKVPEELRIRYYTNNLNPDGEWIVRFDSVTDLKEIDKYSKNSKGEYLFNLNKPEFISLLKEIKKLTIRLNSTADYEQKEILETKEYYRNKFKLEFVSWFEYNGFSDECDEILSKEEKDDNLFHYKSDFRDVTATNGNRHLLTEYHAEIIKRLHIAYKSGYPSLTSAELLKGMETASINQIFKRNKKAMRDLINFDRKNLRYNLIIK